MEADWSLQDVWKISTHPSKLNFTICGIEAASLTIEALSLLHSRYSCWMSKGWIAPRKEQLSKRKLQNNWPRSSLCKKHTLPYPYIQAQEIWPDFSQLWSPDSSRRHPPISSQPLLCWSPRPLVDTYMCNSPDPVYSNKCIWSKHQAALVLLTPEEENWCS